MVHWIVGDDEETAAALLKDPRLLLESVPHWTAIVTMVEGSVTALEFSRQQTLEVGAGRAAFEGQYTFEDALQVAGSISRNFGSFWEAQCQDTKASLVALDTTHTGRVRLPDFYGANKEGEWRFGESEAYLRERTSDRANERSSDRANERRDRAIFAFWSFSQIRHLTRPLVPSKSLTA